MRRRALWLLLSLPLALSGPGAVPVAGADPAPSAAPKASAGPRAEARRAVERLGKKLDGLGATWGAAFVDLATGEALAGKGEHAALNPASNTKLWTAWAALARLGAEHRFATTAYGKLERGRVERLVLRGEGDPTLEEADLISLAAELRSLGVKELGELAVDASFFDEQTTPPAYEQQPNEWAAFRAPVSALAVNGNTVRVRVEPTEKGRPALVRVEPEGAAVLVADVRTTAKGKAAKLAIQPKQAGAALTLEVKGSVAEGQKTLTLYRRVEDPSHLGLRVFARALADVGIKAPAKLSLAPRGALPALAVHRSRPLGEVLARLGKDSDNFAAEMILKTLGASKEGPATFAAGAKAVTDELAAAGAWEGGMRVSNGSGLFDAGRGTPAALAALVRKASRDPARGPEFLAQLAVGGVDGTLKGRFGKLPAPRIVRAKTGTLSSAVALSGVIQAPEGRSGVAFSILVNGVKEKVADARGAVDEAVVEVARALWP